MREVKILSITRIGAADRERIEAVDPAIRFTDAGGWFDGEYRETWPEYAVSRYVPRSSTGRARARNATGCSPKQRSFSGAGRSRSICAPAPGG